MFSLEIAITNSIGRVFRRELRGSKQQLLKSLKRGVPISGEMIYQLSKTGKAELTDGPSKISYTLTEVTPEPS